MVNQTADQIKKSLDAAHESVRRAKDALQKSQAIQKDLVERLAIADREDKRAGDRFAHDINEIVHKLDEDTLQFVQETSN